MNHHPAIDDHSETCWDNGHPDKIQQFDYDSMDRGNPLISEIEGADHWALAGDGLHEIFAWCHRDGATGLQAAFTRFVAVSCLIDPRWLDNETMKQIGERLGITRAAISKVCCEFQDEFSIRFRRCRSKQARLNMAASMKGNHNRAKEVLKK